MSFILDDASDLQDAIVERDIVPGAAFLQGAALLVNGSNQLAECGADPASIAAIACTDVGADTSGFNILAQKNFPPGRIQAIRITRERRFRGLYVGTLPAVDGGSYGIIKDTDNKWKVDFSDTTATRVKLVGRRTNSPENLPQVIVVFLAANVQVMA